MHSKHILFKFSKRHGFVDIFETGPKTVCYVFDDNVTVQGEISGFFGFCRSRQHADDGRPRCKDRTRSRPAIEPIRK